MTGHYHDSTQLKLIQAGLLAVAALGIVTNAPAETIDFTDNGTFATSFFIEGNVTVTGSDLIFVQNGAGIGIVGGADNTLVDPGETISFSFTNPVTDVVISFQSFDTNNNGIQLEAFIESFDENDVSIISMIGVGIVSPLSLTPFLTVAEMSSFDITMNVDAMQISSISFEEVSATQVTIDIKPGSDPNCFNVNGHGVIPIAILGSNSLNVLDIDTSALFFAGLDVRVRGKKGPMCHEEDFNGDEFLDLICQFEDDASMWTPDSTSEATLAGTLLDGTEFEGTDSICVTQEVVDSCPFPPCD